nr:A/G-specific adenine glycosylase [Vaginisenegalia massiliensis]
MTIYEDQSVDIGWSSTKIQDFRRCLLNWYDQNGRDLPWRRSCDPYQIWVSEIMLQQTQVATVIPYFERFIATLPNIEALAQADQATLMSLWQGLGYYSRVRNMQEAAQQIMSDYQGRMPDTMPDLLSLKGVGPYTAAAIGSIAFGLVEPAVDGNLMRIVARLFELDHDISQVKTRKLFTQILRQLIDPDRPGDFNQALMDLGATVMTPANLNPEASPLKEFDGSYQHGTAHLYPVKKKKAKASHHHQLVYFVRNQKGQWLLNRHQDQQLLTGLWHFPIYEQDLIFESATPSEFIEPFFEWLGQQDINLKEVALHQQVHLSMANAESPYMPFDQNFSPIKHVFSHRVWHLQIIPIYMEDELAQRLVEFNPENFVWVHPQDINLYPYSSLQAKLYQAVQSDSME